MLTENNVTRAEVLYPAPPEVAAQAKARIYEVKTKLMPTGCAPLLSQLAYVSREVYTIAPGMDTMAVQLAADRLPVLLINPPFTISLDTDQGAEFILYHESLHTLRHHLNVKLLDIDRRRDDRWTLATEGWINHWIVTYVHLPMPTIDGKVTGVDPKDLYDKSRKAANEQKIKNFPDMHEFYMTEEITYQWLCQINKNPRMNQNFCLHITGAGTSMDDADPNSMTPIFDDEAVGEVVEKVLEKTVSKARHAKNKAAREELEHLLKSIEGNEHAQRVFGDAGAYQVLGQTTPVRKTQLWDALLANCVGSRLEPGERLGINKRHLESRILSHQLDTRVPHAVVAVDDSGSMSFNQCHEKIAAMVGATDATIQWLWWDTTAYPFTPGEPQVGGGGTNCKVVEEWILDNMDEYPDAVICVTDGEFEHFTPLYPERWIWLMTAHGDHWPQTWSPPMQVVPLPF